MSAKRRLRRVRPWWRRFKRNGYRRERCEHCHHPFRWSKDARHASGNRDGIVYHGPCLAYQLWKTKADLEKATARPDDETTAREGGAADE